jgi:histidinol dehydrogenase
MVAVTSIIQAVRRRGDAALLDYAARFDNCTMKAQDLRVSAAVLRSSAARADPQLLSALREAIRRVRAFHEHERASSWEIKYPDGGRLGQRLTPIERAGVYVPGGTASYPSSVVMNIVPAQIAGVSRIVVATPPRAIQESPAVAAALFELGVNEVYSVGGAQAIAALAYGTETIPRVDKITGPGNQYVAAAKRAVFGVVGIDSIAGPSEVVIVADDSASPDFIASDLLAQAEHGEDAAAVLVTTSATLAAAVSEAIDRQIVELPRRALIEESLNRYGAIFIVADTKEACELVNELAPEHLQIMARDEDEIASGVEHAGAIFLGAQTPTAAGDYLAGPNHVLPTSGGARFSSALGVGDFMKLTSIVKFSSAEMLNTASLIATLARAEGLEAHARSALIRVTPEQNGE